MGDFKRAIDYHKKHLEIAIEQGDKIGEGAAYCNLGRAFRWIGDIKQAIEYHTRDLSIAKELEDKAGEGTSYGNLGNDYEILGDFKRAIDYHTQHLSVAKEVGDTAGEGTSYGNLGRAYHGIGDFQTAKEYHLKQLKIAKDVGDRAGEGRAYGNLGKVYHGVGNSQQSIEYMTQALNIAKEVGEKAREGRAYDNLGRAYHGVGDFNQAIKYHSQGLGIAKEVGDKLGQGRCYGNLGTAYYGIKDFKEAIKYHHMHLSIVKDLGDRAGEGHACGNLGRAFQGLGDFQIAMDYHNQQLSIAKQVGDMSGEGNACFLLGCVFQSMGSLQEALAYFRSSIQIYNRMRASLKSDVALNICFSQTYQNVYTALWRTLLKIKKTEEALYVAEQGRAQALIDLMKFQFDAESLPPTSNEGKETIFDLLNNAPAQTAFVALESNTINVWVKCKGNKIHFRQKEIESEDVTAFLHCLAENAMSAIHSVGDLSGDMPISEEPEHKLNSLPDKSKPLSLLYDTVVGPIVDLLDGDELIIVPDGPLWVAPYAALVDHHSRYLCESMRIRLVPSLTCLKLITSCPEGYHTQSGALLIGDRLRGEDTHLMGRPTYNRVSGDRKEVEILGEILKTTPLTDKQTSKNEVLKRIGSAALIHVSTFAEMDTGDIILAPSPTGTSTMPAEEDFRLKLDDLLTVKLQARLVVLTCCHSGREKAKSEGVVGIVRAFLSAGARSVLLSLWRSDDEATIELMRCFYQHLTDGNSASVALHQAMKCLRESEKFGAVKFWAPFVLIGDDVTIDFKGEEEVS